MVDEAGYLTGDIADVAEKLGAPLERGRGACCGLQTFDPAGVCARNLDRMPRDPAQRARPLRSRDAGAGRQSRSAGQARFRGAARLCGVDDEDLADMIAEIKRLNPKPGLAFGSTMVQPIVPDVFVRPAPDGALAGRAQFRHAAESAGQPELPRARCRRRARNPTEKAYLAEVLADRDLAGPRARPARPHHPEGRRPRSCGSRTRSSRTASQHLRPLNLKTVADAISMHESTVSRVTANKYMATTRGIFELKYFFTSSIASSRWRRSAFGRGGASSHQAADRRRKRRTTCCPTTRSWRSCAIAGIDIARRTVAKYREAMRIPSSVQRRREKQAPRAL